MTERRDWSVFEVSDSDEPGDAVLTGMRHRGFDGVELLLWPGDGGWLHTDEADLPVRPLLLFYRGADDVVGQATAWLAEHGFEGACGPGEALPATLGDFGHGADATRTVAVHLNYPPYPWLDEARLGMEMGRFFDQAELVHWTDPTPDRPGSYRFRFFRSDADAGAGDSAGDEISDEDLPF